MSDKHPYTHVGSHAGLQIVEIEIRHIVATKILFIEYRLIVVIEGFNDKDGVVLAQFADERFQLFIIGKSLYQHDDRLTGVIPILPLADRLLDDQNVSDGLASQNIIDLDVKAFTIGQIGQFDGRE